ncbi:membrane fusion protein, cobalt-zinc-cadmium efflux system [Catalinimonas alkaloidigena]|uniref:Membrane fusion protein, cobalt-zinc-cadmium efflux system n=1 Tax=Catalinimonas alkaloidigena TaxID=1075417 RepID=A0A1G9VNL1_9BACT|nr:efflux RND transporter periplasmic adaptor subunit [Catalinimonas alkaloidigena]SDM73673.1 membrane fusion protein, cobalt-zinc-cadmium efflux system [Catalinimonas alkaloidigena]
MRYPVITSCYLGFSLLGLLPGLLLGGCQPSAPAGDPPSASPVEENTASPPETARVEVSAAQYQHAGIHLGGLQRRVMSQTLPVTGMVDVPPENLVSLSAPLGGFVKRTELLQGMRVRKGQVLATLENPEFITLQQDYLESKSQLTYLTLEYERQRELRQQNVSSAKLFQQTTQDYERTQIRVEALAEKLALIGIRAERLTPGKISRMAPLYSPINGYVTEVHVNVGTWVNPTDVLFEIADTDHLHAELTVFERDLSRIRPGQKIRFTLPNEDQRERTATVYLVGKAIGEDRSARVHGHLDKEDSALLPGMYLQARIEMGTDSVPVLPQGAVVTTAEQAYVFVQRGRRQEGGQQVYDFERIPIQTGVSEGDYVQVELPDRMDAATESIVVQGAYALLSLMENGEEEGHGH